MEVKKMENNTAPITETTAPVEGATEGQTAPEAKSFSQEEVNKMLQAEGDRRVSMALAKQEQRFKAQMAEAEKLKAMDESQRKEYEFEQRIKDFEAREKEFVLTQNKLEASKVMAQRGLPVSFVDYLVADNADDMLANINTFEQAFKSAVADAVSAKIASPTPRSGSATQTGMTKDAFRKLSMAQQAEVYRTNPELYKQMTQR